jgi:hypothetical protein
MIGSGDGEDLLGVAARMLGVARDEAAGAVEAAVVEDTIGGRLPASLRRVLDHPGLLARAAATYDACLPFPEDVRCGIDPDSDDGTRYLVLMVENQGVCEWAVPLDAGDDPPVVVRGDLESRAPMVTFASSVAEFVYAFAWDAKAQNGRAGCVLAQAPPLDAETVGLLRATLHETLTTYGWPCRENLRFEGDDGLAVLLWSCPDQCDWSLSAGHVAPLRDLLAHLIVRPGLGPTLWSNDPDGEHLLRELRDG